MAQVAQTRVPPVNGFILIREGTGSTAICKEIMPTLSAWTQVIAVDLQGQQIAQIREQRGPV
jgi:hypothetical protein